MGCTLDSDTEKKNVPHPVGIEPRQESCLEPALSTSNPNQNDTLDKRGWNRDALSIKRDKFVHSKDLTVVGFLVLHRFEVPGWRNR